MSTPAEGFPHEGIWLRCQLHSHTDRSDGEATPDGLVRHYARAGCDVLAVTDHWGLTLPDEAHGLLLLAGSELSARPVDEDFVIDVLAFGIDRLPAERAHFPTVRAAASFIVERGGVAYLPHPYWAGLAPRHFADAADLLSGIEVYNAGCEVLQGNGISDEFWNAVLDAGHRCHALATDDSHHPGDDSRYGWTLVRARERSVPAVLDALREGAFYGTTGPAIEAVERDDDGGLLVRCTPARSVVLRSGRYDGGRANAGARDVSHRAAVLGRSESGLITAARLDPPEDHGWGRVEVHGQDGTRAWSNAIPFG